jgi:hypothetical protein
VSVNLGCLRQQEVLSNEERHRLYLLELLERQLSKKRFLECLILNSLRNKYERRYRAEDIVYDMKNPEQLSPRGVSQQLFGLAQEQEE